MTRGTTISAFAAAIKGVYGIELDLQLSADSVPMVFHDDTLDRLTGEGGPVSAKTAAELGAIRLWGGDDTIPTLAQVLHLVAGRPLTVNQEVFKSEADTNQRNQAIGYLMYAYGYIKAKPLQATDIYTEQCSVSVNAKDLALMAGTLANAGKNPATGKQVMKAGNVPNVLAVMATAGLYDDSGKWLFRTGLPGKSGVGGGLIAVSPGKFGIAVISPPLDDAGNSVRAQKAIADISNALGGNPYVAKVRP